MSTPAVPDPSSSLTFDRSEDFTMYPALTDAQWGDFVAYLNVVAEDWKVSRLELVEPDTCVCCGDDIESAKVRDLDGETYCPDCEPGCECSRAGECPPDCADCTGSASVGYAGGQSSPK